LKSLFEDEGASFTEMPWTNTSKLQAVALLRRWLASGMILLPKHDRLRSELLAFQEKLTPSGAITYQARRSGHDDFVALLLTFAMSFVEHPVGYWMEMPRRERATGAAQSFSEWASDWSPDQGRRRLRQISWSDQSIHDRIAAMSLVPGRLNETDNDPDGSKARRAERRLRRRMFY
jgi:hypothetical protein